ncbi:MAG: hypothetical protein IJG15_02565 [Lachnospiraceae bacterium]|nr:hypothetical protein [Lachnospiraceae bacterium]
MIEVFLGLLGAAMGLAFFIAGFLFGKHFWMFQEDREAPAERKEYEPTPEDLAEIEKQRERLRQDQAAFHDLMGYSADVAYGRKQMPGEG